MSAYSQRTDRPALVTEAAANATGKRFCAHHQGEVAAGDGSFIECSKTRRWICCRCQENRRRQRLALEKRTK